MRANPVQVNIAADWKEELSDTFEQPYFRNLISFLKAEKAAGKVIYPPGPKIFHAFERTPFNQVKVVILGQDPYHGPGQAMGLSFSVPDGVAIPPSLRNIFKELHQDVGVPIPGSGNLESWAGQGVLLLNAALTVEAHQANSHAKAGWYPFTDTVIERISQDRDAVVFMLWGKFAQGKEALIDTSKHLVLKAAHPSPFAADNGFFGCRHFSKANAFLRAHGKQEINWGSVNQ